MKVVGIDPGLNGGIAMWDGESLFLTEIPTVKAAKRGNEVTWSVLYDWFDMSFCGADHAYIEKVNAMPKTGAGQGKGQGVASAFKFGYVAGGLRSMIASRHIPCTLVPPNTWKQAIKVPKAKDGAVARADQLFPDYASMFRGPRGGLKDGPAEAALIAYYGYLQLTKEHAT